MRKRDQRDLPTTLLLLLALPAFIAAGCAPEPPMAPTPGLLVATPDFGAEQVPPTTWIVLEFADAVSDAARTGFRLACDGIPHQIAVESLNPSRLLVNPIGELPEASNCALSWLGPSGSEILTFATADVAGTPAVLLYDRDSEGRTNPFPDDFWLVEDPATGKRLEIELPGFPPAEAELFESLLHDTRDLDGFSPIAHLVLELSEAPDLSTLPLTPAQSLDPLATIALIRLSPGPRFASRVPFRLEYRSDATTLGVSHALLLFPSLPLDPGARYGLVVTTRAGTASGKPLRPSPFFEAAMAPPQPGESPAVARVRPLALEALAVAEIFARPSLRSDDVALALRFTVRTIDGIPADLLAVREQIHSGPAPAVAINSVEPDMVAGSPVAAVVEGTWQAPEFRSGPSLARDAQGRPVQIGTEEVDFVLALPDTRVHGAAPVVLYQHGNPGSAQEEVVSYARDRGLAEAGFAVIGFTDNLNREISAGIEDAEEAITAQIFTVLSALLGFHTVPDYWVQTNAEQLAFLRMLDELATLDRLPLGSPDGFPDLDLSLPLSYVGISEGANHGPALLAYAPEVRAASLVAGGGRLTETILHQQPDPLLDMVTRLYPSLRAPDVWTALALFQTIFDRQDSHNHARFLYRDPIEVGGSTRKASILLIEGLDDSLVPNPATDSLAWTMGPIPHLMPVQRKVRFLEKVRGPVVANVDAETTAAYVQYVPTGVGGIDPTPGCTGASRPSGTDQPEGHFCAQSAFESVQQQRLFLESAVLDPVPRIVDPIEE
jgi:hypothetical protein